MKRALALLLIPICIVTLFSGCSLGQSIKMPFNGEITFHGIQVEIPTDYVRDSTESNDDFWVFEHGGYKSYILLKYTQTDDPAGDVEAYAAAMEEEAEIQRTELLGSEALILRYTVRDEATQEILFGYQDACYSIALRNGTPEEFQTLTTSVSAARQTAPD